MDTSALLSEGTYRIAAGIPSGGAVRGEVGDVRLIHPELKAQTCCDASSNRFTTAATARGEKKKQANFFTSKVLCQWYL